jgi:ribonuclease VapC
MFLDASAIVAILNDEPEAAAFESAIETHTRKVLVSPIARFEAIISLAAARSKKRKARTTAEAIALATRSVDALLEAVEAAEIAIVANIGEKAVAAAATYGRVVGHPAELNLGDCFAYAAAKAYREPILFKGDDFTQTDIKAVKT